MIRKEIVLEIQDVRHKLTQTADLLADVHEEDDVEGLNELIRILDRARHSLLAELTR